MKTTSKIQRTSAAIAAVAVSFTIVWAMSSYAYPDPSPAPIGQLAKQAAAHPRS